MEKLKILYLTDAKDIHTYRWIKFFADKGNEVHIASFEKSDDLENLENVHMHIIKRDNILNNGILRNVASFVANRIRVGTTIFNPFSALAQVKNLIEEIRPDILHGQSIVHHTVIGAFTDFHPFVVTAIGNDILIYPKQSIIVEYAVKHTLKKADMIICDGLNLRDAIVEMAIEGEKINIILYGVDTTKFCPTKDHKMSEIKSVICTRRMGKVHDIETLIRAIPHVLEVIPNVKFVIIGDGEQKDYLINLAESLHVMNNINFTGMIHHTELPKYLTSSDIYVSTSISDGGMAVSNLEAMACELPLIVTDVGDNRKWIKDGENGFIIPIKNPNKLAEMIIYLFENESIMIKSGKINRKIIEEKSNYYKEMGKMEQIYKTLIEGHKS